MSISNRTIKKVTKDLTHEMKTSKGGIILYTFNQKSCFTSTSIIPGRYKHSEVAYLIFILERLLNRLRADLDLKSRNTK